MPRLIDADKLYKAIPAEEDNITGMGMTYDEMEAYNDGIDEQWKKIVNAPTIEPERKKGKWIYGEKSGQDGWYCSECGGFIPWYYDFYGLDSIDFIEDFKTCPFCESKMVSYTGVDMRGEQDE